MTSIDFSNLKKSEVKVDKLFDYVIHDLQDQPTLKIKPAVEANKPYFNALLKRSRKKVKAIQSQQLDNEMLSANRNEDRHLYSEHVVFGWENVKDASGEDVPFTQEHCLQYFRQLPDWIFDKLRNFVTRPENFTDMDDTIDAENTGKN